MKIQARLKKLISIHFHAVFSLSTSEEKEHGAIFQPEAARPCLCHSTSPKTEGNGS